jgi:hypothetical protein
LVWLSSSAWASSSSAASDSAAPGDDDLGAFGFDTTPGVGETSSDAFLGAFDPVAAFDVSSFGGRLATAVQPGEHAKIIDVATLYGVDPLLLGAIRGAENGGPGKEFGILSLPAPTWDAQAQLAAASIKANLGRYETKTGTPATDTSGRYTQDFIAFMGARYAPTPKDAGGAVANDPTGLNNNWVRNVWAYYSGSTLA